VESPGPGQGATFRIILPLAASRPAVGDSGWAHPGAHERREAPAVRPLEHVRILIVDDEPQARELFCAIIENAGGEVRLAASARDALGVLQTWWPTVMLSDIEMPHEDGYVLMEQVSTMERRERRPIIPIAVTAHSRPEDRLRALEAGFQWHLPKPIEPSELVAVIASLADRGDRAPGGSTA
jgi:CheY-like chemotaxis protein